MTLPSALVTGVEALIRAEQARQAGRFIEVADLEAYLRKLADRADVLSDFHAGSCRGVVAFYANEPSARQAYITLVLVAPEARGSGLGAALVRGALEICRARGFGTCRLEVREDNAPALATYRRLGFTSVEDRGSKCLLEIQL